MINVMKKRLLIFLKNNNFYLKAILLALGFCIFLGINNYIYLKRCTELFVGDQIGFLTDAISHFKQNTYMEFLLGMLRAPGLFMIAGILYNFFPINEFTAISANIFFAFFLFLSTYLITYKLSKDKAASLDAVFILFFYPLTFGLSRFFIFEFALMSAVVVFIFFLLHAHNFKNKYFSCLLGASIGLGILTKESFFIFIGGPLIWQLFLLSAEKPSRKQYKHILWCAFFALIFSSIWFLRAPLLVLTDGFNRITLPANHSDITFFSLKNILFYFYSLADFSVSPFFMLLFLICLKNFLFIKNKGLWLSWIIFPYIFFMFFPWKLARYIAPILPCFAIVTAICLSHFSKKNKTLLRTGYIVFGLLQFIVLTHTDVLNLKYHHLIETKILSKIFQMQPVDYNATLTIAQPNKNDSRSLIILNKIAKQNTEKKEISLCQILNRHKDYLPQAEEFKSNDHITNPLTTPLPLYNLSRDYNFNISYCYIDEAGKWYYWPVTKNKQELSDKTQFDFVLTHNQKHIQDLNYEIAAEEKTSEGQPLFLFQKKN